MHVLHMVCIVDPSQAQQTDAYQQMLELQESMGGDVATGLTLAELAKLPVRRLEVAFVGVGGEKD